MSEVPLYLDADYMNAGASNAGDMNTDHSRRTKHWSSFQNTRSRIPSREESGLHVQGYLAHKETPTPLG